MGREVGAESPNADGLQAAKSFLDHLGAPARVETSGEAAVLSVTCCPLGTVTRQMPEMCAMMEAAVSEVAGRRVRQRCAHDVTSRCRFEVLE